MSWFNLEDGERLFACEVFDPSMAYMEDGPTKDIMKASKLMDSAEEWVDSAWYMPDGGAAPKSQRLFFDDVRADRVTMANWSWIWDCIIEAYPDSQPKARQPKEPPLCKAKVRAHARGTVGKVGTVYETAKIDDEGWAVKEEAVAEVVEPHGDVQEVEPHGEDVAADEPPEWVTFEPDARVWYGWLQSFGCDEPSCAELFLLSQTDFMKAANLISKLHKKVADECDVTNPSGYLHSMIVKEWHKMGVYSETGHADRKRQRMGDRFTGKGEKGDKGKGKSKGKRYSKHHK